jgi:UDP-N-acetylmuramoylalanine--D-glutamate ligase
MIKMKLNYQKGKKIGIFGLGLTGCSVFFALREEAETLLCWDDSEANRNNFISQFGDNALNDITNEAWRSLDKIVISPGIPPSHAIFSLAKQYNIEISSDIGLFIEENNQSKIIVVTGTNGKSTTTALIGHILQHGGLDYHMGGNIGLPVFRLPQSADGYVLELSSFQIDLLQNLNPFISILLNITPDHLDRYRTFEKYCESKFRAFEGDGIKIIGIDSDKSQEFYSSLKKKGEKKLIPISVIHEHEAICCHETNLVDNFFNRDVYTLPDFSYLKGKHNQENIAAAFTACRALGVLPDEIIKHLSSFKGLKHRMQYLGNKGNISFYNDSKATNAASAACSLASLNNIFWLAGGIFKEKSLAPIDLALKNVKKAYLFGKDKLLFAKYLENKVEYKIYTTMNEAFECAIKDARVEQEPISILLAPACASYDQFKNFEDRGNQFIELYDAE